MSPAAAAPSSASITACRPASPSECPASARLARELEPAQPQRALRRRSDARRSRSPPAGPRRRRARPAASSDAASTPATSVSSPGSVSFWLPGSPGHGAHHDARRPERGRLIGHLASPGLRLLERGAQHDERGRLRRLRQGQPLALECPDHAAGVVHVLERIVERDDRDGAIGRGHRRDDPLHQLARGGRPRRVVDEDRGILGEARPRQRGDAGERGIGSLLAAGDDLAPAARGLGDRVAEAVQCIGWRDHHDPAHAGHRQQRVEPPAPGGPAGELDPELVAPHPAAAAGRDQHRPDQHGRLIRPAACRVAARRSCGRPPSAARASRSRRPPGSSTGRRPRPRSWSRHPGSRPPARAPSPPG